VSFCRLGAAVLFDTAIICENKMHSTSVEVILRVIRVAPDKETCLNAKVNNINPSLILSQVKAITLCAIVELKSRNRKAPVGIGAPPNR
jgi:hypothetical protein